MKLQVNTAARCRLLRCSEVASYTFSERTEAIDRQPLRNDHVRADDALLAQQKKRDPQAVQAAREIQEAAEAVLDDKSAVTPDLDGTAGTAEMGRAIRRLLA